MSQLTFSDAEYAGKRKKTRREVFPAEMEQVVPWKALLAVIAPQYARGRHWFGVSGRVQDGIAGRLPATGIGAAKGLA